jgi:trehalose 6-phosphate synthase/phosphatase
MKETNASQRLVVISNRLPVRLERMERGFKYIPSVGGLATTLDVVRQESDMIWIGTPGVDVDNSREQKAIRDDLWRKFSSVPLMIERKEFDRFYNGFSNGTIWPLFHYFPQYAHYDQSEWGAYQAVNQRFSEKVIEIAKPDDLIWIHDYHLMLLPALIRQQLPDASIGFFLHIPFPSYEIFRILPWRGEILRGLVGADLIGFHTFGYARHFLSSLVRILGYEHDFGRVEVGDRTIRVETFPLGVDVASFASMVLSDEVQEEISRLRVQVGGRKVILTVDRLDFTKGIIERLEAYEKFLVQNRDWHDKVTLIALTVPSREQVPEYQSLKSQVDELVGRINGRLGQPGWTPILYLYRSVPFEQLVALYQTADVALVTPLRDGMNLVAKEYLASHPDGSGVLILSETAGAAAELGEAVIVNPHDVEGLAGAIGTALEMPPDEQRRRNQLMRARLERYTTARWAEDFIGHLKIARAEGHRDRPRRLADGQLESIESQYRKARARLILLDYDGTLVPFASTPQAAKPDEDLIELLIRLKSDHQNRVVIVSGRDADTLAAWLGETGIDLVAEHGAMRYDAGEGEWEITEEDYSDEWKVQLRPVFEVFVDRTPGSILEEKGAALVWHYRRADPDMGAIRAAELTAALEGYVANTPLHILQGHKVVEVKPSNVGKGKAIQPWLVADPRPDFIFAAGDDVTDEALFEAIPEDGCTVKVGRPSHSKARFFVSGPADIRRILIMFAGA